MKHNGTTAPNKHWSSRWIFVLAALGSAAGLGNVWRFPFLAFEYGGGSFLLAIVIANIIIGIPLLILEVALGQMTQKGAPDALGTIRRAFRSLGWLALVLGFIILAYYVVIMGWSFDYFFAAFQESWAGDTEGFFQNTILKITSGPHELGGISFISLGGLVLAWLCIYFSVWKGVSSISKVVVWTATLPFLLLGILIIRAVTLPGAADGIAIFLIPEWNALSNPHLWLAAFSQVFFNLSVASGIMIAYGSFNDQKTEITKSVIQVAFGNFIISFLAGIVVFGTLGYMSLHQGVPLSEVISGGPSLAFVVFPEAISLLPAFSKLFGILFFGMFVILAVDSAFSLVEGFATAIQNRFPSLNPKKISFVVSFIAFIGGIPFVTGGGFYYLDIVDHFAVDYGLIAVGILEAIAVGWFWKNNPLPQFIRTNSQWNFGRLWGAAIKIVAPLLLSALFIVNLVSEFRAPYGGYPLRALFWIGILPLILSPFVAWLIERITRVSPQT